MMQHGSTLALTGPHKSCQGASLDCRLHLASQHILLPAQQMRALAVRAFSVCESDIGMVLTQNAVPSWPQAPLVIGAIWVWACPKPEHLLSAVLASALGM